MIIQISHRSHIQFFFKMIPKKETIMCMINIDKEMKSHTGYTPSNLLRMLLSLNARTAKEESVGIHITVSHSVKNIQNIMRAFVIEKNSISARIFLFSVLFMLEKNIHKQIREDISNHIKWKLKFWGLNIVSTLEPDVGKYVQDSKQYAM